MTGHGPMKVSESSLGNWESGTSGFHPFKGKKYNPSTALSVRAKVFTAYSFADFFTDLYFPKDDKPNPAQPFSIPVAFGHTPPKSFGPKVTPSSGYHYQTYLLFE